MAHVMITCSETGEAVWTGHDIDEQSWETASIPKETLLCPACLDSHTWDKDDAFLSEASPLTDHLSAMQRHSITG